MLSLFRLFLRVRIRKERPSRSCCALLRGHYLFATLVFLLRFVQCSVLYGTITLRIVSRHQKQSCRTGCSQSLQTLSGLQGMDAIRSPETFLPITALRSVFDLG